jgi:hypothetical protein
MTDKTPPDNELFIHLDLDGLIALMKAAEAAIATGRGRLELRGGGIAVGAGSATFTTVTLTFSDPAGGGLALAAQGDGCFIRRSGLIVRDSNYFLTLGSQ